MWDNFLFKELPQGNFLVRCLFFREVFTYGQNARREWRNYNNVPAEGVEKVYVMRSGKACPIVAILQVYGATVKLSLG
jgi:hypothetical protein